MKYSDDLGLRELIGGNIGSATVKYLMKYLCA